MIKSTPLIFFEVVCFCCRQGSLRADAHLRARPQPRSENHSSGLRTRAFPAGVTAHSDAGLVKLHYVLLDNASTVIVATFSSSGKYTESSAGREASVSQRSALAQVGSPAPANRECISQSGRRSCLPYAARY